MSPEDTPSPELEAMRLQVEQEIDQYWKDEAAAGRYIPEDPSENIAPNEIADLKMSASAIAIFRTTRIKRYLNNFINNLPEGDYRITYEKGGTLDQQPEGERGSNIRLSQTRRQFYETIDQAMKQESINLADFKNLKEKVKNPPDNIDYKLYQTPLDRLELEKAKLSIFIRLRMMGYSWQELRQ